jgi:hypothetical protein
MPRVALCSLLAAAALATAAIATACHRDSDPPPMHPRDGELPPLPSSSGTPLGYLLDNASQLSLTDDQLTKLKDIDRSHAAADDDIDTQIRLIEKPEADPEPAKGAPPVRHNNAPGAQVKSTPDAAKLHQARAANDDAALRKAFALLDPAQQTTARRLLEDRGFQPPGSKAEPPKRDPADGVPLEP